MRTTALAILLVAAACNSSGPKTAADSIAADTSRLSPPVGSMQPQMDSAHAAGKDRIDSLQNAGETPASGIAKGIQPAAHASTNDKSVDTNRMKVRPTNVP